MSERLEVARQAMIASGRYNIADYILDDFGNPNELLPLNVERFNNGKPKLRYWTIDHQRLEKDLAEVKSILSAKP